MNSADVFFADGESDLGVSYSLSNQFLRRATLLAA
jgi:hypothetical protein